jgi:hypothetical protein
MTDKPGITFQQATTFRLHVESELQPGVYEPATEQHLRSAGWMLVEKACAERLSSIDRTAKHMLVRLWQALDRPEPEGAIETSFAEALVLVERRVHSDVTRGWRRKVAEALRVDPDVTRHTPEWAFGMIRSLTSDVTSGWRRTVEEALSVEPDTVNHTREWAYQTIREMRYASNREPPPWLTELLDALGWQGGTSSQAIAAVRRLVEAGHALSDQWRNERAAQEAKR